MAPAFSSSRQAAAFAILLIFLLLLPSIFDRSKLPPRSTIYAGTPEFLGLFSFHRQQIFEEKGDVDIAFLGGSLIWYGIDTPHVQEKLSEQLGRPSTVFTLGWPWPGQDATYFMAKDLLGHRKVRILVVIDEWIYGGYHPHNSAHRWFRVGDNWGDLAGLSIADKAGYYVEAVRGTPRHLLSLVRPDLPPLGQQSYWEKFYHAPKPTDRLGAMTVRLGFGLDPTFAEYVPDRTPPSAEARIYAPDTKAAFQFTDSTIRPVERHFATKLSELAAAHGATLVWLHMPPVGEMRMPAVVERACWPELLPSDLKLMGIPPAALFAGMSDEEVLKLYCDDKHFNQNGQRYFTQAITPALLNYASKVRR